MLGKKKLSYAVNKQINVFLGGAGPGRSPQPSQLHAAPLLPAGRLWSRCRECVVQIRVPVRRSVRSPPHRLTD